MFQTIDVSVSKCSLESDRQKLLGKHFIKIMPKNNTIRFFLMQIFYWRYHKDVLCQI